MHKDKRALVETLRKYKKHIPGPLFSEAADTVEALLDRTAKLSADLSDCRNELCLKCGKYETAHLGSCDGCRWRIP